MKQRPPKPTTEPCEESTFQWHMETKDGWLEGTVYPDGSLLDGKVAELGRCGWAFVVINDRGVVMASASGVPPRWVIDIVGPGAWALYQAGMRTTPGRCRYLSDSLTTVRALQGGMAA